MRADVPSYELLAPATLQEALRLLPEYRPIAGATDVMVLFQAGKLAHKKWMNIWGIDELRGIEETGEHIALGALTTYSAIQRHPTLQREFALLCQAASWTGSIANQNRGTLGGNIANASPGADSPPALLVYCAQLELVSEHGSRWVDYGAFHTGYKQSILRADELIARVRLPRPSAPRREYMRKVGTRRAQAISKVCFAGVVEGDEVRIAIASVAPTVIRCTFTEAAIREGGDVKHTFLSEIAPIDDIRSTAAYRRRVAANLLEEFLHGAR